MSERLASNGSVPAAGQGAVRPPELTAPDSAADPTVGEMAAAYLAHAGVHYVRDGRPTTEPVSIRCALRPFRKLYGGTPAASSAPCGSRPSAR